MIRRPPRSTRTDTLFPYTTLFRSSGSELFDKKGGRAAFRRHRGSRKVGHVGVSRAATLPAASALHTPPFPLYRMHGHECSRASNTSTKGASSARPRRRSPSRWNTVWYLQEPPSRKRKRLTSG